MTNPRRACAARVSVSLSVCLPGHISRLERLLVLKILSRAQRSTEVKGCFSETAPLKTDVRSAIFLRKARACEGLRTRGAEGSALQCFKEAADSFGRFLNFIIF